jgi:DNA-binding response OmpR family regulator
MALDVLIVDDDEDIRDTLTELLQDAGYEARALPDAKGLYEVLEQQRPRLVLLDLNVPGEEGSPAILDRARGEGLLENGKVFALSGLEDSAVRAAALRLDGAVQKPFDVAKLLEMVESVCRGAPLESATGLHSASP